MEGKLGQTSKSLKILRPLFSAISIFNISFKRPWEESLKLLIENLKPVPLRNYVKWLPFKVFAKLHKSSLLIDNIMNWPAKCLRHFLENGNF